VLRVTWKRLIAIDTHQEVPAGWQVERQGNAATVAMLGLLFPEIPASGPHVRALVRIDGLRIPLAVLHHGSRRDLVGFSKIGR
jgi:hypothetical protein